MKNRKKAKSFRILKRDLDKVFSIYIRKRDTNAEGYGHCITCTAWSKLQCGHFIKRQHLVTRWVETNAAGQCARCNHFLHGNEGAFCMALIKKHGQEHIDKLLSLKHTSAKFTRDTLTMMIDSYRKCTEAL